MEKGQIIEILETQVISDRFQKREFVILQQKEYGEYNFENVLKFEFTQDKCDLLNKYSVGDHVEVDFNLKGRRVEKNGNVYFFTTLDAWKISKVGNEQPDNGFANQSSGTLTPEPESDLPF